MTSADAGANADVPVRDAATVMLLRDGHRDGVEVCMLQRQHRSAFVAGMFVFPGGAVDPEDHDPRWGDHVVGLDDTAASARLGLDRDGLAYWVAAVRESLEECALFLASRVDGTPWRIEGPTEEERFRRYRAALDAGEVDLLAICESEDLRLDVGGMHYFGHWITPPGAPRRYDTRFFLAAAPADQEVLHDGTETIASRWMTPAQALEEEQAGDIAMLPPTIANLRAIAEFASVHDALRAAAAVTDVPTVAPRVVDDGGGVRIVLPGDPDYDQITGGAAPAGTSTGEEASVD